MGTQPEFGKLVVFGVGLIGGSIAAALKHHFIDRDDVLIRMLPRRKG